MSRTPVTGRAIPDRRCERAMSFLRVIFGQAILVMSGQGRKMYQYLKPKPEGTIFSKRSEPQGKDRTPHDASHQNARRLNRSYEAAESIIREGRGWRVREAGPGAAGP